MKFLLAGIALSGHLAIGTILINRLHATALPYWLIKVIDAIWVLWHGLAPFIWLVWVVQPTKLAEVWPLLQPIVYLHLVVCAGAALWLIPGWLQRSITRQMSSLQLSNDTHVLNIVEELGHRPINSRVTRYLSYVPFNEIMELHVNEKVLVIPRLEPKHEGITITHLSDVHYTGDISTAFHHEVIRQANRLGSDIIAVTGDLIDNRKCMSWLGEVLGRLKAPYGVYFVLGNHDVRVRDEFGVRNALTAQGLIDLGRRWIQTKIGECPVILAGNELPWFVPAADMSNCPIHSCSSLRILLSHAPDQLPWARNNHIDLMLAGHTHGGQVQLPLLGPVFSPSRFGVRHVSGTFFEKPTLMHVSRGISGTRHLRINAPPELTKLILVTERR